MAEGGQPSARVGTPEATSEIFKETRTSSMLPASDVNEIGTSKGEETGNRKPVNEGEETWLASYSGELAKLSREREDPYFEVWTLSSKGDWILSVFDDPNIVKKSGNKVFSFSLPEDPTILVREPSKLRYRTMDEKKKEAFVILEPSILEKQDVKDLLQMVRGPNLPVDIGEYEVRKTVEKLQEVLETEDGTFKDVDTRFDLYTSVLLVALQLEGVIARWESDSFFETEEEEEVMVTIHDRIGRRVSREATLHPGRQMWLWMDKLGENRREFLQELILIILDDEDFRTTWLSPDLSVTLFNMDYELAASWPLRYLIFAHSAPTDYEVGRSWALKYIFQYLLPNGFTGFMHQLTDESDNDKMDKARGTLQWHVEGIRIKKARNEILVSEVKIVVSGVKCRAWIYTLIAQERHDRHNMGVRVEPFIRNRCLHDFKRQVLDYDWDEMCMANIRELFGIKDQITMPIIRDCLLTWAFITNQNDLIWCIMLCKPTRPFTLKDDSLIEKWKRILWLAAAVGDELVVEQLLVWDDIDTHISQQNEEDGIDEWNEEGGFDELKYEPPLLSAIHVAVLNGHTRVVELLCKNKYAVRQVHEEDYKHRTPLKLAIVNQDKDTIKILMGVEEVAKRVDQLYRDRQVYVDAANAILVGAALIAGVTFAGWLQPPTGYDETYIAIQGKPSIEAFVIFNSLAFFLAIATVLAGANTTFFSRDEYIGDSVESMRLSLKLTTYLLICAVICVLGAFASAGIAILPPIRRYKWSMIVTIGVGIAICGVMIMIIMFRSSSRLAKWIEVPYRYLQYGRLKLRHFIHAGLQKHKDQSSSSPPF